MKGFDETEPEREALFAASVEEGQWVMINPEGDSIDTIFIHLGWYAPYDYRFVSSGDIVSIQIAPAFFRTFATLKCSDGYSGDECDCHWLAEIDPVTGTATLIGKIGFRQVFGLGFWGEKIYGFTNNGEYILIDVETGEGNVVEKFEGRGFWGAGTTTRPYVTI